MADRGESTTTVYPVSMNSRHFLSKYIVRLTFQVSNWICTQVRVDTELLWHLLRFL